jgi:hypothetical protein
VAILIEWVLIYLAIGVVGFAHPAGTAEIADFTWHGQWAVFRDTLSSVVAWPLALRRR